MSAQIESTITLPDGQGGEKVVPIRADLSREYVAARDSLWGLYQQGIHALPSPVDDLERDWGPRIYERMALDPEIAGLITLFKSAVLSQAVDLASPVEEDDPDAPRAQEILDATQRSFDALDPTLYHTLHNMLDAMVVAHKVAELVFADGEGEDAGRYILTKVAVKERTATAFVVDPFGNVEGFLALAPGQATLTLTAGALLTDADKSRILPREKFAVFALGARNGDPRGNSMLRPAYNTWWLKMQTWPELLKYLAQFGSASVVGITGEHAQAVRYDDGTTVTAQQAMLGELIQFANGRAAAFSHGSDVKFVQAVGNGEAFRAAIDLFDRQNAKAITGQTLATGEGEHQARASSVVHQDILGLVIMALKRGLCEMLARDIIRTFVAVNFGRDALHLAPRPSLGDVERQDVAALMTAAIAAGYSLDASQSIALDAAFDMPPRDPESVARAVANQQAGALALSRAGNEPPQPPNVPPPPNLPAKEETKL